VGENRGEDKMPRPIRMPTDFPEVTPSPEAVLRGLSEEELPVTAGLGAQERDYPQGLGAFGEEAGRLTGGEGLEAEKLDWTPVSDEQAQRQWEETQIENARIRAQRLSSQMLNTRRDLIERHYAGDDPSLRNTKPITDELRKVNLQTFKASAGDPEEMTPRERLLYATQINQIGKEATVTTSDQKQRDVDRLSQAVEEINTALGAQIGDLRDQSKQIQEKHIAQDEAIMNQSRKSVAMQRLFNMRKAIEKLDDEPPPEMIEIYNSLAEQLGEQTIDVENQ
jgi:hypothetical protein